MVSVNVSGALVEVKNLKGHQENFKLTINVSRINGPITSSYSNDMDHWVDVPIHVPSKSYTGKAGQLISKPEKDSTIHFDVDSYEEVLLLIDTIEKCKASCKKK